jgi:hypothetical protein
LTDKPRSEMRGWVFTSVEMPMFRESLLLGCAHFVLFSDLSVGADETQDSDKSSDVQLQDNGWLRILQTTSIVETWGEYYSRQGGDIPESLKRRKDIQRTVSIQVLFLKRSETIQREVPLDPNNRIDSICLIWGLKTKHDSPAFATDYHFKVFVTFFDESGLSIETRAEYIYAEKNDEVLPGEERTKTFLIPDGAKSWKVWVPK